MNLGDVEPRLERAQREIGIGGLGGEGDAHRRGIGLRRAELGPRRLAPGEASGQGLKNLAARYAFLSPHPLLAGPEGAEFVATLPLLVLN